MRDKLAIIVIAGYFGSIVFVWLSFVTGLTLQAVALDSIRAIAQYGASLVAMVLGYYFTKERHSSPVQ